MNNEFKHELLGLLCHTCEYYLSCGKNLGKTRFEMMVIAAARELSKAVQEDYYHLKDLKNLNYTEVREWCNWPDFQDGNDDIYEQAIKEAANMILEALGYKPQH